MELFDSEGDTLPLSAPGDIDQRQPSEVYLLRAKYGGPFLVRVQAPGAVAVPYSVELFAPVFVPKPSFIAPQATPDARGDLSCHGR